MTGLEAAGLVAVFVLVAWCLDALPTITSSRAWRRWRGGTWARVHRLCFGRKWIRIGEGPFREHHE